MALQSPGVQVTVIDESFYTPAEPGTTPLIVIATAESKSNAAGTGTAAGTTQANAGKVFKITSQRELVDTYGVPFFEKTASSSPIHGGERNEYGLLAAYSFLGVSNSVFIVRADVDLDELQGQTSAPGAEPADGQWWFDTRATSYGIQEWNGAGAGTTGGQKFGLKIPLVLTDDDSVRINSGTNAPKDSVGAIGDYAVVAQTIGNPGIGSGPVFDKEAIKIYYKRNQALLGGAHWVEVGSQDWAGSHPTVSGSSTVGTVTPGQNFTVNGTTITTPGGVTLTDFLTYFNGGLNGVVPGVRAVALNDRLYFYTNGATETDGDSALANSITIAGSTAPGSALAQLGISAGTFYGPAIQQTPHTSVPEWKSTNTKPRPTGSVWIKTTEPNYGARYIVKQWNSATKTWVTYSAPVYSSTHAALYYLDRSGGGQGIATDNLFVQSNSNENSNYDTTPETASFRIFKRATTGNTVVTSNPIISGTFGVGLNTFTFKASSKGNLTLGTTNSAGFTATASSVSFTATGAVGDAELMATAINAVGSTTVEASVTADNAVQIIHKEGGDIRFTNGTGAPISDIFTVYNIDTGVGTPNFYVAPEGAQTTPVGYPGTADVYLATNWIPLAAEDYAASATAPLAEPQDGQLWYTPVFDEIDIMVHNGDIWVGYKYGVNGQPGNSPYFANAAVDKTDPNGPIVSASEPTKQSDGTDLKNGDLWISTADLENFPTIYRYDGLALEFVLVDKTDQTTEDGILFADARYGSSGASGNTAATIKDLLVSNFVDFDCPDPALYPKGMLLWNLRRSGGNVKRYSNNYIDPAINNVRYEAQYNDAGTSPVTGESMGDPNAPYATDRWVTASPNNEDGSGSFGRKAQRSLVVQKLKSAIDTSSEARDEERRNFNLIACPGYPEAYSNLINLNLDRGVTAFVVADTPLRLPSDATSLTAWGTNANGAVDNNDTGIVSYDEFSAVYYPNGFTTDLGGASAVVPASHMMLRTIALSDQVSYPWFAPAGTRRGGITNATAVGYIDADTGEFQSVALNEGQRDTLYDLKVNPIPFFVGVGLVAYGQKTRARNASALDRVNVARLVVYLRSQLNKLARPYIFEPNDKITRDEIKGAVESLLIELVGLRALYDFAVVCDESNNTPSRIDRNELYVDIAIEPVKAIEFIYIPLRIKNTGEI